MLTQTLTPTQTLTLILTLIPTLALTLTQTLTQTEEKHYFAPRVKIATSFLLFRRKWLVLRYVTPIKRIREQRVRARLLIYRYSFVF